MKTAVVMTVCDRPRYLAQVLEGSWLQVDGLAEVDWWFMLEPTGQQAECWSIIHDFCRRLPAGSRWTIWPNERRLGVLENPYQGMKLAFGTGYDYVILAEDDVLVSRDVLAYHAWAAHRYRDQGMLAVCSHQLDDRGGPYDVGISTRFDPLVWGTWAGTWQRLIEPTWDHDYSTGPGGGVEAGWDWNLNRVLAEHCHGVVKPAQSRSLHIGKEGGTHCTPAMYPGTAGRSFLAERVPGDYQFTGATLD
jgi:hypothetical protein